MTRPETPAQALSRLLSEANEARFEGRDDLADKLMWMMPDRIELAEVCDAAAKRAEERMRK